MCVLDWIVVALYFLVMVAIGVYAKSRDSDAATGLVSKDSSKSNEGRFDHSAKLSWSGS